MQHAWMDRDKGFWRGPRSAAVPVGSQVLGGNSEATLTPVTRCVGFSGRSAVTSSSACSAIAAATWMASSAESP